MDPNPAPPTPPPPPPPFAVKQDPFILKRIQQLGTFEGCQTEELESKIRKSEDIDASCFAEAEGTGIVEDRQVDPNTHYLCPRCEKWIPNILQAYHQNVHSSKILDWMYLGALNNSENHKELTVRTNISYILNAAQECVNYYPQEFTYLHLDLTDFITTDITQHFDECFAFIEECRQAGKNILIHCAQGKSRSVTIVLMYLMRREKMTLREAYEKTKAARNIIKPNAGFMKQLIAYEQELFGSNSIEAKEITSIPD